MENKYLWDIIDKLRDELNIASDGIVDLNDVVKDLQAELENYQCGCKYPKELKNDAEEYFHHNPQDEKIWYMLITKDDLDEDGVLDAHKDVGVDAVAEFDNYQGKISGDVFK